MAESPLPRVPPGAVSNASRLASIPDLRFKRDLHGVDWFAIRVLFMTAKFDRTRDAATLERCFRGSYVTCLAYSGNAVIGTARAIGDGICAATVFDVCVLPRFQRHGLGREMMARLLRDLPNMLVLLVGDVPKFYQSFGFHAQPRAMALENWARPEATRPLTP